MATLLRAGLPPGEAHLVHQTYRVLHRGLFPICDRCIVRDHCADHEPGGTCRPAAQAQAELEREVMAQPNFLPVDRILVRDYARWAIAGDVLDLHIAHSGALLDSPYPEEQTPHPASDLRLRVSARMQSLAAALGIGPVARARLKASGSDALKPLAAAILEVDAERRRAQSEIVEGEFTEAAEAPQGDEGASTPAEDVETPFSEPSEST